MGYALMANAKLLLASFVHKLNILLTGRKFWLVATTTITELSSHYHDWATYELQSSEHYVIIWMEVVISSPLKCLFVHPEQTLKDGFSEVLFQWRKWSLCFWFQHQASRWKLLCPSVVSPTLVCKPENVHLAPENW